MTELLIQNGEIIRIIMQALLYGFLTGLAFFVLPWGVRLVLSVIKT